MELRSWHRWDSAGLTFYKAWNLEQTGFVTHGFTTRIGGASSSPFESLNLGLHVDDRRELVLENRERCLRALGLDIGNLTTVEQVHGCRVAVIGHDDAGAGSRDLAAAIEGADAMVTNISGVALGLFFADCAPVYIVDPAHRAIGLAHAGWKGSAADVATETLRTMAEEFGTEPRDCQAAIGPAIGRCCYDVGIDVAEAVWKCCDDQRPITRGSGGKFKVDLQVANWCLLRKAGVPEERIAICLRCTACNEQDFFSYRRDGRTGRMAAIMAITSER
ncbi:MAG: peptidoglycan editing factor PgeF [Armatimonadota bacterium]|nr:peptidoglycan editing factor PgeF [Armatimonadota bacterium]